MTLAYARPGDHEGWCEYYAMDYESDGECTCDLDKRQALWDATFRHVNAAPLPRAIVIPKRRKPPEGGFRDER